jgi:hypothetical protein
MMVSVVAAAGDSRMYQRSIEPVWDEAVKAARDAELEVTDSSRAEHWFTMRTKAKTLSRSHHFEVRLVQNGDLTTVTVEATSHPGSKKSRNNIAKFFEALHERMN